MWDTIGVLGALAILFLLLRWEEIMERWFEHREMMAEIRSRAKK
jgi:hypothetical protein